MSALDIFKKIGYKVGSTINDRVDDVTETIKSVASSFNKEKEVPPTKPTVVATKPKASEQIYQKIGVTPPKPEPIEFDLPESITNTSISNSTPQIAAPGTKGTVGTIKAAGSYLFKPDQSIDIKPIGASKTEADMLPEIGNLPRVIAGPAKLLYEGVKYMAESPLIAYDEIRSAAAQYQSAVQGKGPAPIKSVFGADPTRYDLPLSDGSPEVPSLFERSLENLNKLDKESPNTPKMNVIQTFIEGPLTAGLSLLDAAAINKALNVSLAKKIVIAEEPHAAAWIKLGFPKTKEESASLSKKLLVELSNESKGFSDPRSSKLARDIITYNETIQKFGIPAENNKVLEQLYKITNTLEEDASKALKFFEGAQDTTQGYVRPAGALPGTRVVPGQSPAFGLSVQRVEDVGKAQVYNVGEISKLARNSLAKNQSGVREKSIQYFLDNPQEIRSSPVRVREVDGQLVIEDGRHRLEAADRLGMDNIDIIDVTPQYPAVEGAQGERSAILQSISKKPTEAGGRVLPIRGANGKFEGSAPKITTVAKEATKYSNPEEFVQSLNVNQFKTIVNEPNIFTGKRANELLSLTDDELETVLDSEKIKPSKELKKFYENSKDSTGAGLEKYTGAGELTTRILESLVGKTSVNPQYIKDLLKSKGVTQAERMVFEKTLKYYDGATIIPVKEFADKVAIDLLPLTRDINGFNSTVDQVPIPQYANITLPYDIRGEVVKYTEIIYQSPIATSAGDVHFRQSNTPNYFAHTRIEDMADGKTRRVIEAQSDLFQKADEGLLIGRVASGTKGNNAQILQKVEQLKPYKNTWHERLIREEIRAAAKANKTKLQFPTGETAMKVEGLGDNTVWSLDNASNATPDELKVGKEIYRGESNIGTDENDVWIITDVLGDGKFKAVPKRAYEIATGGNETKAIRAGQSKEQYLDRYNETFDISGKVDTNNPIYKFYENTISKYLNKVAPDMRRITDEQGVEWFEINVPKDAANKPVQAFNEYYAGINFDMTQEEGVQLFRSMFDENEAKFVYSKEFISEYINGKEITAAGLFKKEYNPFSEQWESMVQVVNMNGFVPSSTVYHEGFHTYVNNFMKKEDLAALKDTVRERLGMKMSDYEVEEWLADDFARYAKTKSAAENGLKAPKYKGWLAETWDKVIAKIKEWMRRSDKVRSTYDAILAKNRPEELQVFNDATDVKYPQEMTPATTGKEVPPEELSTNAVDAYDQSLEALIDSEERAIDSYKAFDNIDEIIDINRVNYLQQLQVERDILASIVAIHPAKPLMKFTDGMGNLREITGQAGRGKFRQRGDVVLMENGFEDIDAAQKSVDEYRSRKVRLEQVEKELKEGRPLLRQKKALERFLDSQKIVESEVVPEMTTLAKDGELSDITNIEKGFKDLYRNFEKVFGREYPRVRDSILKPFDQAKKDYITMQKDLIDEMDKKIVKELGIKRGSEESKFVMDYGEGDIPSYADLEYMAGKSRAPRIAKATEWFRDKYDNLLDETNKIRKEIYPNNPEKIIPKRKDYFRHFFEMTEGLEALKNIFDNPAGIDPSLAGLSDFTSPRSKFLSFAKRRLGIKTERDAVGGFIDYIPAAAYAQKIDPQIGVFRRLRKELVKGMEQTQTPSKINNFIEFLHDFSNDLAGKTNPIDRSIQKYIPGGRTTMKVVNWVNGRVKSNTLLLNAGSTIAQIFNLPQAIGSAKLYMIPGMKQTIAGIFKENIPMSNSQFISERYFKSARDSFPIDFKAHPIKAPLNETKKFAAWLLGALDEVSTKTMWNAFYEKAIANNIDDAVRYADDWTRKMVGGRGIGEVPMAQKSQFSKIVIPFQLEVGNLWWVMGDMVKRKDFGGIAMLLVASYAFNRLAEEIRGSDVGFDPINALVDGIREFQTGEDFSKGLVLLTGRLGGEVLSNVPGGQTIASMYPEYGYNIPGIGKVTREEFFGEGDPTRFGGGLLAVKALADPIYKILPPFGGGQLKKSVEGIGTFVKGQVDAKDGDKNFDIDKTTTNFVKSLLFGKYATKEARDFFNRTDTIEAKIISQEKEKAAEKSMDLRKDAENMFRTIKEAPKENRKQLLVDIAKSDEKLAREIIAVAKEEKAGLTYTDRQLKSAGVESGARAYAAIRILDRLDSSEEKKAQLKDWAVKKVITRDVLIQIVKIQKSRKEGNPQEGVGIK